MISNFQIFKLPNHQIFKLQGYFRIQLVKPKAVAGLCPVFQFFGGSIHQLREPFQRKGLLFAIGFLNKKQTVAKGYLNFFFLLTRCE